MPKFEAFKASDGHYRWRVFDESGSVVPLGAGRKRGPRFTGKKRLAVEKALDEALARIAAESQPHRANG